MYSGRIFDFATPTPASRYFLFPVMAGSATALGALLISLGQQMPVDAAIVNGAGWGLVSGANTLFVSIYAIGNERAAWFEKQAEIEANKVYPELGPNYAQEVEAIEPEPATPGMLTVAVKDQDTGTGADLYTPPLGFWRMARYGGADAASTSEGFWTGAKKPFSLDEFRELRDWMIEQKLAVWKNDRAHAQGWEVRPRARAIMRGLAKLEAYSPPLPRGAVRR